MNPEAKKETSGGKFFHWHTIQKNGVDYMTRIVVGRLRLHIFHTGDLDRDPHDHPWGFWTMPLGGGYVEKVFERRRGRPGDDDWFSRYEIVRPWRWTYRAPEHTHQVLGRWDGLTRLPFESPAMVPGRIWTLVWMEDRLPQRQWGFLKKRNGRWCWQDWVSYVYEGGANQPCGDEPLPEEPLPKEPTWTERTGGPLMSVTEAKAILAGVSDSPAVPSVKALRAKIAVFLSANPRARRASLTRWFRELPHRDVTVDAMLPEGRRALWDWLHAND